MRTCNREGTYGDRPEGSQVVAMDASPLTLWRTSSSTSAETFRFVVERSNVFRPGSRICEASLLSCLAFFPYE